MEFLDFSVHRNCQLSMKRWQKWKSLSPVRHAHIWCFSDQCCKMQNKNVILRLSRPEVLLKNINVKFLIIHIYLWHVLKVCKCPVHHVENHPYDMRRVQWMSCEFIDNCICDAVSVNCSHINKTQEMLNSHTTLHIAQYKWHVLNICGVPRVIALDAEATYVCLITVFYYVFFAPFLPLLKWLRFVSLATYI